MTETNATISLASGYTLNKCFITRGSPKCTKCITFATAPGKTTLTVPLPPHLTPNLHIFIDTLEVDASVVDVDADHRQQHLNNAKDYYQHASYCKTEFCFAYLD